MKGKEYVRPMGATWWLERRPYTLFILRELTALFIGGYAIFLLVLLYQAQQGLPAFTSFVQGLNSPVSLVLHAIVLLMALYHTITWFNVTPKVLVFWRGEHRVAAATIIAAHWILWLVVSAVVVWLATALAG